ncbi:PREDICTED: GDSL esterase/lipase At3g05180 isoform X2 [Camelina sativa]|uniref:GDSL esterase/lipase At3g05180 isoform X2 n=1 Tax=Camelina sativa TaxID=90675 RepID=A0ABM0W0N1_CAMSA|nr:PREDICTED: GDSL esterase/lipase At3g05180 isoform X2 [Camelina sativa]
MRRPKNTLTKAAMENLFLTLSLFVAISHTLPHFAGSFPISHNFPAVFNFGDSNSDTGELTSGLGFLLQPSFGQTYFKPPSSGRFCNGRLIVDFLMEAIDRPYLRPYLDSMSRQSYQRGCNFAAAASTIQKANAASYSPFGFGVQVSQFITFKSKVIQLIHQDEELKKYLPSEYYFKNGLYMFDIGQNDLAGAFYSKTFDQVLSLIPTILDIFQDGITRLHAEGARNFWIHNTGPLGCLAQVVSRFGKDKSKLDEFGCVSDHNQAAQLFNLQLNGLFKKLPQLYPGSRFTYVDIFSIKSDLILNHSKYGFDHSILVCCGTGGPPLNYDDQVGCGNTATSNGTTKTAKPCIDSSKYVNWDGIHYTEAANRFVTLHILTET